MYRENLQKNKRKPHPQAAYRSRVHGPLHLYFFCYRSTTNASISLQNGHSLVFLVFDKTVNNRIKLLKYKALKQM